MEWKKGCLTFIVLLLFLLFFVYQSHSFEAPQERLISNIVVKNANKFLYVRELKNDNRGPEIDQWLDYSGVGKGNPYCQAFVNYMYYLAYKEIGKPNPLLKTARCATFAKWATKSPLIVQAISIKQIRMGFPLLPGDILNWKHGIGDSPGNFSYDGHAGLLSQQLNPNLLLTIEGNTKPTNKGDQTGRVIGDSKYGNDGVYNRQRGLGIGSNFQIMFAIRLVNNKF